MMIILMVIVGQLLIFYWVLRLLVRSAFKKFERKDLANAD